MDVTDALRSELTAANDRLIATVARLSDADVAAPSRLPGWTRGHVLAHLARNADSQVNLLTWARTGVETPQYPDLETRDAEIEAGAPRPAKEQLADLEDSTARLFAILSMMTASIAAAQTQPLAVPQTVRASIDKAVTELTPTLVEVRRDLHRHPELGFREKRTCDPAGPM